MITPPITNISYDILVQENEKLRANLRLVKSALKRLEIEKTTAVATINTISTILNECESNSDPLATQESIKLWISTWRKLGGVS